MKVYQKPSYFKGGDPKEREKLHVDTTQILYLMFYFNDFGLVDSTIYYPHESGFQRKAIYRYNGLNIVENTSISNSQEVVSHWLLQQTQNNEFIAWTWDQGHLYSRIKSNADSIMTESLYFSDSDTSWNRAIWFDPEKDTRIEHMRGENGKYIIETFQWFSSNGQPKSFKHSLEKKESNKSKVVTKEKVYDLDSSGNVVNKYLGRFDDPYLHYNYFDRLEKLKPATFNEQNQFREDQLFKEVEVASPYNYSGIDLVYLYKLEYEYWE